MTHEVAKGVNFVFAKEYILKEYGEQVWQRALARLPDEQATLWSGAIVPFDRSLNAVYKIFFKLANPSFVIGNYPKLWSRFFTTGSVTVPTAEKGFAKLHFQLPEMFLDWLGPACLGYSNKAVSMSGGRNVLVEELSRKLMPGGHWEVDFEIRWSE
jgi:hypothetical protein